MNSREYEEILGYRATKKVNYLVGSPPGYSEVVLKEKERLSSKAKHNDDDELKMKRAWEIALSPAKSIPMNLVMSYMTGNSLQLIPIMTAVMLFWNPLKAIFTSTNSQFKALETKSAYKFPYLKVIYVMSQVACMSIGIWKLHSMGLISNSESDWLSWKKPFEYLETSIIYS